MASCGCDDFDFTDINLDDDWDAEVPGGVDESVLALENAALEEVLVVGPPDPENEECRVEFTEDWRDELETLLNGPDLIVTSEWTPTMESDGNSLSTVTTSKHQKKQCPICFQRPSCKLSRHVISNHLPWFGYPRHACWECRIPVPQISRFNRHQKVANCFGGEFREVHENKWVGLVNHMLRFIADALKLPGVPALLQFVRSNPELWPDYDVEFQEDVKALMDLFQRINGFEAMNYTMSPPNCVAALLHWRILLNLICRLPPKAQEDIRSINTQCSFLGEPKLETTLREKPVAADAHCHFDLMLQKMRVTCYDDAFEKFTFPDMDVNVNIVIPCYAFPNMFPGHAQLDQLPLSAWNFAAGFHPRSAEYEYPGYIAQFRSLARMERAVAIGEVGIDYTRGVSEHTIRKQHRLLEEVVFEARDLNKPVVIHCRGGKVERNATLDCLTILRAILPKTYPVYVHCFTGGFQDFKRWIQAFPNVVFGFNGSLLQPKKRHPELIKVVAAMDLGRILLETDAPLLLLPKYHGQTKHSNPFMVADVATEIGMIRHMPTEAVLATTHHNTRRFFNLIRH